MGLCNCNCSCNWGDPEDGYGDWIEEERTCRVKSVCSECHQEIMPGDEYIAGFMFNDGVWDTGEWSPRGSFYSYDRCLFCEEIMDWANCDCEGYVIGSLWQDIDDAIADGNVDLDSLGKLSPDALDVITDRIEDNWDDWDDYGE